MQTMMDQLTGQQEAAVCYIPDEIPTFLQRVPPASSHRPWRLFLHPKLQRNRSSAAQYKRRETPLKQPRIQYLDSHRHQSPFLQLVQSDCDGEDTVLGSSMVRLLFSSRPSET